jgi:hypothetical protein
MPWVKMLAESYCIPKAEAFIETKFQGAVPAGWRGRNWRRGPANIWQWATKWESGGNDDII